MISSNSGYNLFGVKPNADLLLIGPVKTKTQNPNSNVYIEINNDDDNSSAKCGSFGSSVEISASKLFIVVMIITAVVVLAALVKLIWLSKAKP